MTNPADGPTSSAAAQIDELEVLRAAVADAAGRLTELRSQQAALRTAHRELLGFLARDLRTPLAQMDSLVKDLQSGVADSPDRSYKLLQLEIETLIEMLADFAELADTTAPSE